MNHSVSEEDYLKQLIEQRKKYKELHSERLRKVHLQHELEMADINEVITKMKKDIEAKKVKKIRKPRDYKIGTQVSLAKLVEGDTFYWWAPGMGKNPLHKVATRSEGTMDVCRVDRCEQTNMRYEIGMLTTYKVFYAGKINEQRTNS